MLLWFAGLSLVIVWQIFKDPAIDYRLIVAGALLPDVVDGPLGGPRLLHTLAFSVALLVVVMLGTRHRRRLRRRLLALPIGTFVHLLLDGMWADTRVFWWPIYGGAFRAHGLPSLQHPIVVLALEELAGAVALWWCWHRFGLSDPGVRARFLRSGRVAA